MEEWWWFSSRDLLHCICDAVYGGWWRAASSDLAHKLRLELHRADAVDLAVDVVVAIAQANALDLGAHLDHQRRALDLEVLDHGDGVAVLQDIADRVLDHLVVVSGRLAARGGGPLVGAFRADQHGAVFIGVFGVAFGAGGQSAHAGSSGRFG